MLNYRQLIRMFALKAIHLQNDVIVTIYKVFKTNNYTGNIAKIPITEKKNSKNNTFQSTHIFHTRDLNLI